MSSQPIPSPRHVPDCSYPLRIIKVTRYTNAHHDGQEMDTEKNRLNPDKLNLLQNEDFRSESRHAKKITAGIY